MTAGRRREGAIANIDDFTELLPRRLLDRSGSVFFSGRRAFNQPCDLYVLGLNPAGDPTGANTIRQNVQSVLHQRPDNWSAWRDERWGGKEPGRNYRQRRVLHLLREIGRDPGEVPTSEVVFLRSTRWRADLGDLESIVQECWPFHQAVIETLGVRVIVCLGGHAGYHARHRLDAHELVDEFVENNRRRWKSRVHANARGLTVATLTHPSQADWTVPETDPTQLVERSLAGRE